VFRSFEEFRDDTLSGDGRWTESEDPNICPMGIELVETDVSSASQIEKLLGSAIFFPYTRKYLVSIY
jgi:hypothetical protein